MTLAGVVYNWEKTEILSALPVYLTLYSLVMTHTIQSSTCPGSWSPGSSEQDCLGISYMSFLRCSEQK